MKSAVTVSLVPEARGGPFVFWDDLDAACGAARRLGFDAVEIFPPGPEVFEGDTVSASLSRHDLKLAAVGTGAGWVKHKLTLTSPDAGERRRAVAFVRSIIDAAARFGAPAIIGSMQGRWGGDVSRDAALGWLRDAMNDLGAHAGSHGLSLLYEPLNRYETNLCKTLEQGGQLLASLSNDRVRLLADLFHMNIEENSISGAIRDAGSLVGHVHLADSNRAPAGLGHTDFEPIGVCLQGMEFDGYVSAEAIPVNGSENAAWSTMDAFNRYFRL